MTKPIRAYKAFNADLTCRDFQYEIGNSYKMKGKPVLCERGFHACSTIDGVFYYYPISADTRICEVELSGTIRERHILEGSYKLVANNIKIIRELTKIKIVRELTEDEVTKYALDQFKLKLESLPLVYALLTYPNLAPFISDKILYQLVPFEQKELAIHGSQDLLKRLLKCGHPSTKQELVRTVPLYPESLQKLILDTLVKDSLEEVRAKVATYGKKRHRSILMNDVSAIVREQVALFATKKQLDKMVAQEQNKLVLCAIYKNGTKEQKEIVNDTMSRIYGYNFDNTERND